MNNIKISSINIQIADNREIKLTIDQARELYEELGTLFDKKTIDFPTLPIPTGPIPRDIFPNTPYTPPNNPFSPPSTPWLDKDIWWDKTVGDTDDIKYRSYPNSISGSTSTDVRITSSADSQEYNIKL
jgi:hypothetical protein